MGRGVKRSFIVSPAVYTAFQQCSGDYNPLYTDEEFVKGKGFPERVMYGNILNAFVFTLIGECLPTKNVIIHSQDIQYKKPVYLNDALLAELSVEGVHESVLADFKNNVLPIVSITQAAISTFKKKKNGRIVTVLSSYVIGVPPLGYGLYASMKACIAQFAKTWSKEYVKFGITSNCVSPEFMETDFTADTDPRVIEKMVNDHPLKNLLKPQEVAEVIVSLVHAPKYVNGVNIPVNTGSQIL